MVSGDLHFNISLCFHFFLQMVLIPLITFQLQKLVGFVFCLFARASRHLKKLNSVRLLTEMSPNQDMRSLHPFRSTVFPSFLLEGILWLVPRPDLEKR